jgi:hypothetical protein
VVYMMIFTLSNAMNPNECTHIPMQFSVTFLKKNGTNLNENIYVYIYSTWFPRHISNPKDHRPDASLKAYAVTLSNALSRIPMNVHISPCKYTNSNLVSHFSRKMAQILMKIYMFVCYSTWFPRQYLKSQSNVTEPDASTQISRHSTWIML